MNREQVADFLIELSKLTRAHGIAVSGCGCCDSPFLRPVPKDDSSHKYGIEGEGLEGDRIAWSAGPKEYDHG